VEPAWAKEPDFKISEVYMYQSRVNGRAAWVTFLTLLVAVGGLEAQAVGSVSGEIVHARSGRPLNTVQVVVVGTGLGALTDSRGQFTVERVPAGEWEVQAQILGYRTVTETVLVPEGGSVQVSLRLQETAVGLDELVVTGTPAAARRLELGQALSRLDGEALTEVAPITSASQVLQSRTAGVTVLGRSGMVGAGSGIRIRGQSSLSLSNRPLIYIDGIRVDNVEGSGPRWTGAGTPSRLDDLVPEDISSIEIIKGPAAATLYGTEASNGVIQILTRRGTVGMAPTINMTVTQGASWLPNQEKKFGSVYARLNDGTILEQNIIADERAAGREVFRTGHAQGYVLSLRGGMEGLGYYLSAELDDTEGYIPGNDRTRMGARGNIDLAVSDRLDVAASFGYTRNQISLVPEGGTVNYGIMPNLFFGNPRNRDTQLRGFHQATPEAIRTIDFTSNVDRVNTSVEARVRPLPWLTGRAVLGADIVNETNRSLYPRQPEGSNHLFGSRGLGEINVDFRQVRNLTFDLSSSARRDLNSWIVSTSSVGFQFYGRRTDTAMTYGREFPAVGVETVSAAAVTLASQDFVENNTVGAYFQQQIGIHDRLFLTAAVRGDDNSAFGERFDAAIYPKVSGSWLISSEQWWQIPTVNQLRLRGAWGQSGMQPEAFAAIRLYQPITGPGGISTLTTGAVGNPDLGPERGSELELGFDASFFDDVFDLAVTYYDQTTQDAILTRQVAPSTGFAGSQFVNVAEVSNQGFEIEVNSRPIRRPQFGWDLGLTFSKNQNRIESLGEDLEFLGAFLEQREGYPMDSWFDQKVVSAEFDPQLGRAVNVLCDGGTGSDGRRQGGPAVPCSEAPAVYHGHAGPGWEASVNTTFQIMNSLRVFANVGIVGDHKKFSNTRFGRSWFFQNTRERTHIDETDPVVLASITGAHRGGVAHRNIFIGDASFIRFREMSATYEIPTSISERFMGASRASVNLAGRNLGLWTDYSYPEVEVGGTTEQTIAPHPTQVLLRISVTF